MIRVSFLHQGDELIGFLANGHALYDDPGKDIVCAAVSAVLITAGNALERVAHVRVDTQSQSGGMRVVMSENPEGERGIKAQAILAAARSGLLDIQRQYPGFVRVYRIEQRRR